MGLYYKDRMKLYTENLSQELEIHWLSILNSVVLVVLLTGFIAIIILRVLKSDYSRYQSKFDDPEADDEEDYGWKLLHGDVFRFPPHKSIFCAFVGIGFQFLAMMVFMLALAVIGIFYPGNGGSLQVA